MQSTDPTQEPFPLPEPPTGRAAHPAGRTRRRVGAAALGATLVAGGGAGALATALVAGGGTTTVVRTVAAETSATASTTTIQSVVAKVEPALVDIHTTGSSSSSSSFGSGLNPFGAETTTAAAGTGMIIRSDGLILTNAHVLAGATSITVTFDGQTASHPATLVGEDAARDIALIKVSGSNLPTVTLASASGLQAGDSVLAIGNALDLQTGGFTVSNGIVSGLGRAITTDNAESLSGLIQTDAAISSGDSGGALVDAAGQVVGMNTAAAASSSTNTAQDIGFAIPTDSITAILGQLEKGDIGTPTFGSSGTDSSGTDSSGTDSSGTDSSGTDSGSIGGYGGFSSGGTY